MSIHTGGGGEYTGKGGEYTQVEVGNIQRLSGEHTQMVWAKYDTHRWRWRIHTGEHTYRWRRRIHR